MATKRWTVTDDGGRRHQVLFRHGLLGVTVYVDRGVVGRRYRLNPSGSYIFTVHGRAARLDVTQSVDGTDYALVVDGQSVGDAGIVLSQRPQDSSPNAQARMIEVRLRHEQRRNGGALWFYWIGCLSLLNSLLYAGGTQLAFPVGLGLTQLVDGLAIGLSGTGQTPIYAVAIDVVIAGVFMLIGRSARAGSTSAYLFGMILYALDTAIFLLVQDWLSIAFHGVGLLALLGGWRAGRTLSSIGTSTAAWPDHVRRSH